MLRHTYAGCTPIGTYKIIKFPFAEIIIFQNYARRRMSNAYIGQTQYR